MVIRYPNPWSGTGLPFEPVVADALVGADGVINCAGGRQDIGLNDVLACVGAHFGALTCTSTVPGKRWRQRC